jgi:Zn-dependent metalloprotease
MKKIIHYIAQSIRPPVVLLLAILLLIKSTVMAQDEERLGPAFDKIAKPQSTRGWIYFWENYKADPRTLFDDLGDAFKFSQDDKMMLIKTVKDDIGFTHYRYQQYYKNYQVVYGEYIVHQQPDGFVNVANGRLITGLKAGNIPTIAEKQALDAALQFMGARKYLWQNPELEKDLKRQQNNDNATYFPKENWSMHRITLMRRTRPQTTGLPGILISIPMMQT